MLFKKKESGGILISPLPGQIIPLSEVKDPVFAEEMLGRGFAVMPRDGMQVLKMPADGIIISVSDSAHAINVRTKDGIELLIHVGIDTVALRGNGFELLCTEGDLLSRGDPIMNVDFPFIRSCGKDTVTPVIITNSETVGELLLNTGDCNCSDHIALRYEKKEDGR